MKENEIQKIKELLQNVSSEEKDNIIIMLFNSVKYLTRINNNYELSLDSVSEDMSVEEFDKEIQNNKEKYVTRYGKAKYNLETLFSLLEMFQNIDILRFDCVNDFCDFTGIDEQWFISEIKKPEEKNQKDV